MKLFKYREINDWTKGLIARNEVYFPPAIDLDDPLDCGIKVDFSTSDPTVYRQFLRAYLHELLKPVSLTHDQLDAIVERHYREQSQDLGRFIRDMVAGCVHATRNNKGVFSMSASPTIPDMWRLYGDNHRGVCLEVSVSEVTNNALEVRYVSALRTPNFFDESMESLALEILTTKLAKWAYQEEWRIVEKEFPPGLHKLSKSIVSGVIFGSQISPSDRILVEGWLVASGLNVPRYQAKLQDSGTRVELERIP